MPAYKVYCLDGQGRLVSAAEIIEAQSDAEVVALMRESLLNCVQEARRGLARDKAR